MEIEATHARRIENRLGQDQPVGDDDRDIEIERGKGLLLSLAFQRNGREDGKAVLFGKAVHRRQLFGKPAARLARRLRINRDHFVAGGENFGEDRHREIGRAHEGESEAAHDRPRAAKISTRRSGDMPRPRPGKFSRCSNLPTLPPGEEGRSCRGARAPSRFLFLQLLLLDQLFQHHRALDARRGSMKRMPFR